MPEILILADDLSGAADCAGGCAAAGLDALVLLEAASSGEATASVLAIDLHSRDGCPAEAGRAMARALGLARDAHTKIIYQKMDSTLRGNWAHELVYARGAIPGPTDKAPLAIVAPAFPRRGRISRQGRVLVGAERAVSPGVGSSGKMTDAGDIAAPLRQLGLRVGCLPGPQLRQPVRRLAEEVAAAAGSGVDALVCDAETDRDLAVIVTAVLSAGVPTLWVGSAGLMRQLAQQVAPNQTKPSKPGALTGPILFVVGSASATSLGQFEALAAEPEVTSIRLRPDDLRREGADRQLEGQLEAAIGRGFDTALLIERAGTPLPPLDAGLVATLAEGVGRRLGRIGALVATGGETARRLLARAGIWGVRLGGEVEVGVPWGIGLGERGLPIITKAGAFGDNQTLVACRKALREEDVSRDPL
jgi:D-threonate/D-erythronate kinase